MRKKRYGREVRRFFGKMLIEKIQVCLNRSRAKDTSALPRKTKIAGKKTQLFNYREKWRFLKQTAP